MAGYNYMNRKVEPVKNDRWRRPSSLVRDSKQVVVPEYRYSSPTKVEPVKNDRWHRPSSPARNRQQVVVPEYSYISPARVEPLNSEKLHTPSSPVLDCPPKVEEFITKVQTEDSRPTKPFPLSSTNWRNIPNSTGQGGTIGYGGKYTNYNNSDWNKSNNNTKQDENNKDYYKRNDGFTEPTIASRDGSEKPGQKGWTTQPSRDSPLSGPTNDIEKAVPKYKNSSPTKVKRVKNDKRHRPSSPAPDRQQVVVPEYSYISPARVEPVNSEKLRRPSSPVLDRPPKVEEFITKVQIEASRPTKPFPLSSTNWRNIPNSTSQGGTTGYGGEYTNYNNSDWNKPSNNTMQDENNKDYYKRNNGIIEPTIASRDGWEKPGQKGWTTQPNRDFPLSGPTNDIGKAVPEYQYSSSTKVEPVKNDKWCRPSSPAHDRQQVVVSEYSYISPGRVEQVNSEKLRRPSNPVLDLPLKVEEFITKVQTEASQPTKPPALSSTNWHNVPNSIGQGDTTSYGGEYTNYNNSDWNKPSNNTMQDEKNKDFYKRNDGFIELASKDGWEKPSQKGWTTQPSRNSPLSRPTNDIEKTMEILKEAFKNSSIIAAPIQPRFPADTIDSKEAARRYGKFNMSSRTGETYSRTISSEEAAQKYNGQRV